MPHIRVAHVRHRLANLGYQAADLNHGRFP
jgi:hypothetical protein